MRNFRLETAKGFYKEIVETAEPTVENTIWDIKQDALSWAFEEIFKGAPSKDEQKWLDQELKTVTAYTATEAF